MTALRTIAAALNPGAARVRGVLSAIPLLFAAVVSPLAAGAQTTAPNTFVDPALCATCHAEIAADYARTGMGRAFFRPSPANTLEDFSKGEFDHEISGTHYSMTARNGEYFQRRRQIGLHGAEINVEELKIDYVLGSGNHARAYLHRTASGALIELPLGWYSEKGGYFGMSPGFDTPRPMTRRFASYECVFCHDAYPHIPRANEAPGSNPIFTGDLPEGIDCQRCHGPGGNHIRAVRTAGARAEAIRASIVNPARLSPKLRMDVCMQCHLETTSTQLPSLIRRFNRGPFSYRPGEPLENFVLAFDHAPGTGREGKFEIVGSAAYRMRQSRCFLRSNGAMTCLTCHDPHKAPRGSDAVKHYTAVCRQCHAAPFDAQVSAGRHTADSDCTACHMPKRRTEDVVHVVMTDHLIQRRPPADLLAELSERHPAPAEEYHGEVTPYYPPLLPRTGENALYYAVAQVAAGANMDEGLAELAAELARLQPREAEFYMTQANALRAAGKPAEAAAFYEKALRLRPDMARGWVSLAAVSKPRAAEALRRAIQVEPGEPVAWFQLGVLDLEHGRPADALREVEKSISLDPYGIGTHTALASILTRLGAPDQALTALRDALRIDPYDATAYDLSGRLLAGKGDMEASLFNFETAVRLRPGYGPHLYDYALALLQLNRFDEAQAQAETALAADPKLAEAHELLGGLLARKRRFPDAVREYERTLELAPSFNRAHLDLASVLAAQGDMPAAIAHLREAAKGPDPQVASQATQALARLGSR